MLLGVRQRRLLVIGARGRLTRQRQDLPTGPTAGHPSPIAQSAPSSVACARVPDAVPAASAGHCAGPVRSAGQSMLAPALAAAALVQEGDCDSRACLARPAIKNG